MQKKQSDEKIAMIDGPAFIVSPQLLLKQSQVYRIRKILLILLGILLVFHLVYLIFVVHAYIDYSWINQYFKINYELLWTLMSIVYDTFGLLVVYRYSNRGLCVFAWIGTISLISLSIAIGIICTIAFYTRKHVGVDMTGPVIFIIVFFTSSIFQLIIILLSFKLSKLLISYRHTTNQSI